MERVQDHIAEEYEEVEKQIEKIMKEMTEVMQVLEKIWVTKAQSEDATQQQAEQSEETIVQITTLASKNFNLTKDMLRIDEDLAHT